jgi:hypothetical protein
MLDITMSLNLSFQNNLYRFAQINSAHPHIDVRKNVLQYYTLLILAKASNCSSVVDPSPLECTTPSLTFLGVVVANQVKFQELLQRYIQRMHISGCG